jgi:hypothetical protein
MSISPNFSEFASAGLLRRAGVGVKAPALRRAAQQAKAER